MSTDKPFRTFDEQVQILASRGMTVRQEDKTTLMREGYYSLVNGYKDAFIDPQATSEAGEDRYREGTSFEHLHLLFDVDRYLRESTFPLIVRAETTFRTALAYSFSDKNRSQDAYLDPSNYCAQQQYHSRERYESDRRRLIQVLQAAHDNQWRHPAVAHYLNDYGHVPLWVLVNVLTFGNVSHLYALSTAAVRNETCKIVAEVRGGGRIGTEQLRKAVSTLVDFRNICAHDDRLYCARVGLHRERTFADMLDALAVIVEGERVEEYKRSIAQLIDNLSEVPSIKAEVLRGMRVDLEAGTVVRRP